MQVDTSNLTSPINFDLNNLLSGKSATSTTTASTKSPNSPTKDLLMSDPQQGGRTSRSGSPRAPGINIKPASPRVSEIKLPPPPLTTNSRLSDHTNTQQLQQQNSAISAASVTSANSATPSASPRHIDIDPVSMAFLDMFKEDRIDLGEKVEIFTLDWGKLPHLLGPQASSLLKCKASHASCGICIDISSKDQGYISVTVRGQDDTTVSNCKAALESLAKTTSPLSGKTMVDLTLGSALSPNLPPLALSKETSSTGGQTQGQALLGSATQAAIAQLQQQMASKSVESSNEGSLSSTAQISKDVKLPQKFVGMIIGAGGQTIVKIRKHCGAEIALLQDTASEGYSIAQISGTEDQVNLAVDILDKMIASGIKAKEGYAEYLRKVQSGEAQAAPFKPEKVDGLEFLEDEMEAQFNKQMSKGKGAGFGKGGGKGGKGDNNMGGKGGFGSSNSTPRAPPFGIDPKNHKHMDSFNVPKQYLGLLIGKNGDAIKKFRAYAAEKNMAIQVQQIFDDSHGTVMITGDVPSDITSLKADLTQNLFKAITSLEDGGGQGAFGTLSVAGANKSNNNNSNSNNRYGPSSGGGGINSFNAINNWGSSRDSGNSGRNGPYGNGNNFNMNNMSNKGGGKGNSSPQWGPNMGGGKGSWGGGGFNNSGGGSSNNNMDQKQDDARWWADVFTQVLHKKSGSGSPNMGPTPNMSGPGWGNSTNPSGAPSAPVIGGSAMSDMGMGGNMGNMGMGGDGGGGGGPGAGRQSEGDLGSALAALLGNSNW